MLGHDKLSSVKKAWRKKVFVVTSVVVVAFIIPNVYGIFCVGKGEKRLLLSAF